MEFIMINILVACGSGVATSTLLLMKWSQYVLNMVLRHLKSQMQYGWTFFWDGSCRYCTHTNNYKGDIGKPHMSVAGFVTALMKEHYARN